MTSKLLFFDIDGTLITEGPGVMPESTKLALKRPVTTDIFSLSIPEEQEPVSLKK